MTMEQVEFEFPDEKEENARKGGSVVGVEPKGEENDKPEIEVVDDTPEKDRDREPMKTPPPADLSDDDLEKYDLSVRSRIKQVQNALLEQAKKVVANELEQAKRKYKEAYESGDSDALVAAQEELTTIKMKSERVNNFKPAPVQTEKNEVQPSQQPTPSVPQVDPKLRAWQDDNPWFGPNKRMTAYALGLHEELTADGVSAGSDDYYKAIDAEMRSRFPDVFESGKREKNEDAPPPPKKSNVVAPATRSTAPKKIVLTKTQVELAKRLGVPLELYARKVAEEMRK